MIIDGHPDPSPRRLNHALADRYAETARALGNEVRRINVAEIDFPVLRDPDEFLSGEVPQAIADAQRDIAWADHLVFFYPTWISDVPALLKAFIEQTFRPGFALEYGAKNGPLRKLLVGKSARFVVTMGMPASFYRWFYGEHMIKSYRRALEMCGVTPVAQTLIGSVGDSSECKTRTWFKRIARVAERDSAEQMAKFRPVRAVATAALTMGAVYLAYFGAMWLRYGTVNRTRLHDPMLDSIMPNYEVGVRHGVAINAPADLTFDVIKNTDFERSPIVRAIFRAREILLRARSAEQPVYGAFIEEITALGWTILAEEEGHEIVLGTVTQPWQPNPVFRSLPSSEFVRFKDPGFAKIAFTLRVDPTSEQRCEASTETRVQTTDLASRALFRSYWAFLSPGINLIRRVLLQQIRSEAEARYECDDVERGMRS